MMSGRARSIMSHVVGDPIESAAGERVARVARRLALSLAAVAELSQPAEASAVEPCADVERKTGPQPAVLALDGEGRLLHRSASAAAVLETLHESAPIDRIVAECGDGRARTVVGRDGLAYVLQAVPAAPGDRAEAAAPRTYVLIAPASLPNDAPPSPPDRTASLASRLGLSPREHEMLRRVARGDANKAIAAALGLSMHTVQEYVGRACRKAGVRTRRELVARLLDTARRA
jgi:DNA-binding CsgD family transcriptional regulator